MKRQMKLNYLKREIELAHRNAKAADTLGKYAEASWWEERGQELINELKGYEVNNHDNDK